MGACCIFICGGGRGDVDNINKKTYNNYIKSDRGIGIMASTNINIRMDADLKRQFEAFCADMGMTMTTAFNVFAKKAVRENRIPLKSVVMYQMQKQGKRFRKSNG